MRRALRQVCVGVAQDERDLDRERIHVRPCDAPDGRKVKATLHWVAAETAVSAEVRLYDHLFVKPDPDDVEPGREYTANLNPDSLRVVSGFVEPSVATAPVGTRYQFERLRLLLRPRGVFAG